LDAAMNSRKAICKITWQNGKIYVGSDLTDSVCYFGAPDRRQIELDVPSRDRRRDSTIRKEVIWELETATDTEVRRKENELIRAQRANDPRVGYNCFPRWCPPPETFALCPEETAS
jgi:hypothetical protein